MPRRFYFRQFSLALAQSLSVKTILFQTIQFSVSTQFSSIYTIDMTYQPLSHRVRVDLGAMAIKGCSAFPKSSALLKSHHQIVLCPIQDIGWRSITPLQRCRRCILQSQFTEPPDIRWGNLNHLQRCSRCILQPQFTGPPDIRWGNLTHLQRCSRCILQLQFTGPQDIHWEDLPLYRDAVGVFYSFCRLGQRKCCWI